MEEEAALHIREKAKKRKFSLYNAADAIYPVIRVHYWNTASYALYIQVITIQYLCRVIDNLDIGSTEYRTFILL